MRLLHTTNLEVVNFVGDPPRYAILSHTWEDEEVSLHDLYPGGKGKQMKGYAKLQDSSALAASQGYEYIWIDTCCIDKTISAELSEAINSMFRWYQEAGVCYAFLNDVSTTSSIVDSATAGSDEDAILREVVAARWFTRGWTLQELIAPKALHFFNRNWVHLGSKDEATRAINLATGIPPEAFLGSDLSEISVYRRMQWVSTRTTTRQEDMAYCMLGIFDVNMPLLYGEGRKKAFLRLQEEIMKGSTDLSIYLWTLPENHTNYDPIQSFSGLLAEDPSWFTASAFRLKGNLSPIPLQDPLATITNKGVNLRWAILRVTNDPACALHIAMLAQSGDTSGGIVIQQLDEDGSDFCRVLPGSVIWVERYGPIYKISHNNLLGGPQRLLAPSASTPRNISMRQTFRPPPGASLGAMGFSFSETGYYTAHYRNPDRISRPECILRVYAR